MTIEEIKIKKRETEESIKNSMNNFIKTTGLTISDLDFDHILRVGTPSQLPSQFIVNVDLEIKL